MATQIVVPTLGEAISDATLVNWLVNEGDPVRRGDEIAELETAKANLALESPANGVLLSILVPAGATVTPGQALALVGRPGEAPAEPQPDQPAPPQVVETMGPLADEPIASPQVEPRGEWVSPAARRLARQLGIDLSKVTASKPGARITTADVKRFANAAGSSPAGMPFHRVELSRVQKAVAERMLESARQVPQFSVSTDVDVSRLLDVKQELAARGIQTSLTALLVKLTAAALGQNPLLNARFDGDAVLVYETVNLAVAAATPAGLVAPVIHAAEKLSLSEVTRILAELLPAAREERLNLDHVSQATFTLSNLGMHGVQQFVPMVTPPQSAVLGVGAARLAALPAPDGRIRTAWLLTLTVSADHRVLDGEAAARFLASLRIEIEKADFSTG